MIIVHRVSGAEVRTFTHANAANAAIRAIIEFIKCIYLFVTLNWAEEAEKTALVWE